MIDGNTKWKILTIRQPFASALLSGVYDAERRRFRLEGPTLIHAGTQQGMLPKQVPKWLRDRGASWEADYAAYLLNLSDERPVDSGAGPLGKIMLEAARLEENVFPGRVIGYVEGWEPVRESATEWANKPINPKAFGINPQIPQHKGVLGLLAAPDKIVSSLRNLGLLP